MRYEYEYEIKVGGEGGQVAVGPDNFFRFSSDPASMAPVLRDWEPKITGNGTEYRIEQNPVYGILDERGGFHPIEDKFGGAFGDFRPKPPEVDIRLPDLPDPTEVARALAGHPQLSQELTRVLERAVQNALVRQRVNRAYQEIATVPDGDSTSIRNGMVHTRLDKVEDHGPKGIWWNSLFANSPVFFTKFYREDGWYYATAHWATLEQSPSGQWELTEHKAAWGSPMLLPEHAWDGRAKQVFLDFQQRVEAAIQDVLHRPLPEVPTYRVLPAAAEPQVAVGDTFLLPRKVTLRCSAGSCRTSHELERLYESSQDNLRQIGYRPTHAYRSRSGRTASSTWSRPPINDEEIRQELEEDNLVVRAEKAGPGWNVWVSAEKVGRFIGRGGQNVRAREDALGIRIKVLPA